MVALKTRECKCQQSKECQYITGRNGIKLGESTDSKWSMCGGENVTGKYELAADDVNCRTDWFLGR